MPGFVKKRASKEFNRGYSPKKMLKGFLGVTLLVSVANAGSIKDGLVDWLGDRGGDVANGTEIAGPVIVAVGETAIDGTKSAVEGFQTEFDGDLPVVPSIDISTSGTQQTGGADSAVLNLSGVCDSGNYSLAAGPWGALEKAKYSGSIPEALAQHPDVVAAAQDGAQTVTITCG
jgi:hypothetical protein